MGASPHLVTIDFRNGWPHYDMTCEAAPDAQCRARFTCGCEEWDNEGVTDGVPWHSSDGMDVPHVGTFDPSWCLIAEWFNDAEGEENLTGEVSFRVREKWDHDSAGYTYVIVSGVSI